MSKTSDFHDDYYIAFYGEEGTWNTRYPNNDEITRTDAILPVVGRIASEHYQQEGASTLRILDVGSGRGWLTYVLGMYGDSQGVEPVAGVVDRARQLYPQYTYIVGTPQTMLELGHANSFDIIVCTEVIEHVPTYAEQADFMQALATLITKDGHIVLTTPRGEIYERWMAHTGDLKQPVENWLTKTQLHQLARDKGLTVLAHQSFATHGLIINNDLPTRIVRRLLRLIGYANVEPTALMTYQLVHLRK